MTTAWYSALIAFGLWFWGLVKADGILLLFALLWTYNTWKYQQEAFLQEDHDRANRGDGEGPGQEGDQGNQATSPDRDGEA